MTIKRIRRSVAATAVALLGIGGVAGGIAASSSPAEAVACTTSSTSGNCGPFFDSAVFRTANAANLVTQNDFSSIPQTLTAQNSTSWTVAANTDSQGDKTSVKSYPATQVTYTTTSNHPEPSATFGSTLTSNWTNTNPSGTGQDYEYAFDDWLANPANNSFNNDLEVMIWTDNHGQRPAGNPNGQVYTDDAGVKWDVWLAGGSSSVSSVSTVSFVREGNAASGSIDRIGFYDYLQTHSLLASTYGIDQLNYGLEVCSAGSGTKTYGVTNYSIVKNGVTPTPTPTPTTPTPTPTTPTPTPTPTTPTPTPTPTPTQDVPVLSNGHVVSVSNNGATLAWNQTVSQTATLVIKGPGPINGKVSHVTKPEAVYTGLKAGHTYTVTIQPTVNGVAEGNQGRITFVTTRS
jgi:cell division septation protein DedD